MKTDLVVSPRKLTLKECGLTRAQVASASFPARYKDMVKAMKRVDSIDECRTIYAESEAMAVYFKQLNDPEPAAMALSIKARAYRRIGELLNRGARHEKMSPTAKKIAADIARMPEADFETALAQRPVPGIVTLQRGQVRKERGDDRSEPSVYAPPPPPNVQAIRAARLKDLRFVVQTAHQVTRDPTLIYNFNKNALEKTPLAPSERACVLGLAEDLIACGEYLISICKK